MAKKKDPVLTKARKAQIVKTAVRILSQRPHQTMTLEEVARESGVSKGLIVYYFGTKDNLVVEAIDGYIEGLIELFLSIARSTDSAKDRLQRLIDAAFSSREVVETQTRFLVEVWSFAKNKPDMLRKVREAFVHYSQATKEIVQIGAKEGYVGDVGVELDWFYLFMHALFDGLALQVMLDDRFDINTLRMKLFQFIDGLFSRR